MEIGRFILLLAILVGHANCYIVEPGPVVKATKGEVWPKPQKQEKEETYFVLRPSLFTFQATGAQCEILDDAFQRYWALLNQLKKEPTDSDKFWKNDKSFKAYMDTLSVNVDECKNDDVPFMDMDESYTLNIGSVSQLFAKTIWGALRGLETFSQLVHYADDETTLIINTTTISDYPRFSHRGLLIDTSRHFIPKYILLTMLDAMSYNKLNVFHWHIVDDHSFPFQSLKFPELSQKGAFHPNSKIYTPKDVEEIIEYARIRGIRVIPEFDTPGHTRSWGLGVPEILTACEGQYEGKFGPLDPSKDFVYTFLEELLSEVDQRFPDQYVHLGGDEVGFECWESNTNIKNFMAANNISNYVQLETYYIQRLINIADKFSFHNIVWEEVFTNGVIFPNSTIVHVWKEGGHFELMDKVTKAGFFALLSGCWYLDHIANGGDWKKYYDCEPLSFNGSPEQNKLVMGGEACMWAEAVNEYNIIPRVWPRASATAEKLWSAKDAEEFSKVQQRLEEHTCRMNKRGISAQPPNGPGVCL